MAKDVIHIATATTGIDKSMDYFWTKDLAGRIADELMRQLLSGDTDRISVDEIENACDAWIARHEREYSCDRELLIGLTCRCVVEDAVRRELKR